MRLTSDEIAISTPISPSHARTHAHTVMRMSARKGERTKGQNLKLYFFLNQFNKTAN